MSQSSAAPPVPPAPSEWLTTEQVMERLLEDPALSRLAATCVLPAVRCGDEWRFRRADLDQWIERQRRLQSDMKSRSTSRRD